MQLFTGRCPGLALALLLATSTLASCGGGRWRYPTAESPLALDRVVLYRNGIGYFERLGRVEGDALTIRVRKDQVNDLLKSLTVVERSSGRAVSVSMPLDPQTWASAALATLRPGQGSLAQVLDSIRGTTVTLRTAGRSVTGRVVLVEAFEPMPAEPASQDRRTARPPRIDHRVTLMDGAEMEVVVLSEVRGLTLEDGDLAMQFNRTLDASAGEGMFQQVAVSIRLAGASEHDLLVSYVVAAPMWKPTYRVVLPREGKGKALLQAWAVVDNTSGEEWSNVNLGLTSGAPIAFRYDLHTPREVPRADLTESGVQRQAQAMLGETSYEPAAEPAPAPPPPSAAAPEAEYGGDEAEEEYDDAPARKKEAARPRPSTPMSPGAGRGPMDRRADAEERPAVDHESLRRSTQAQARAQTIAGQTHFEIEGRVTVPEGTSTMVAIINADVEGEEAFMFRPGGAGMGYEANPYRVVRFKNSTPFALEPGPISIYAGGSFVGEGLSETVGAGTSATIPFAVETGILVNSSSRDDREEMRLIKISRGVLEVEQFARRSTTYTARAQTMDKGFTVLVRHPKSGWNYELAQRPKGTEELASGYLVRLAVPAGKREGSITLVEQTPSRSTMSIWNRPALELLEKLLVHADLTPEAKRRLRPVVDRRRELARLEEQIAGLTERRNKLDQRSNELRENIRAIQRNTQAGAQRAKWTRQLDEFTSEANKLGAQLAELEARRMDKRIELEDTLQELDLAAPQAPAPPAKKPANPAPPR